MDSFEDLGIRPELIEALAAEGIERPTPLQEAGLPVVRRGNSVVLAAGPGAGTLVTYGVGLLDRLDPDLRGPEAVVLVPSAEAAQRLAACLGRLAATTGHTVAALGGPWFRPESAQVLFATPDALLVSVGRSEIPLDGIRALVVDGAATLCASTGRAGLETLFESIPEDAQRVLVSLPVTPEVADLADRHLRRAVHVPPRAVEGRGEKVPARGSVAYRVVTEPREEAALPLVAELFSDDDVRRVVLYVRSEDRAADVADLLTLHGYAAGAPGEDDFPVWLAADEMEALPAVEGEKGLVSVSVDVPDGPDALDRRHGSGRGGTVLVLPREVAHLKDVAVRTGYQLVPSASPEPARAPSGLAETLELLESALSGEDVDAYLRVLEPLFEKHAPAEVAAAALALLRKKVPHREQQTRAGAPAPAAAWTHLFVSLGRKDDAGPGDLVGAITGETGIDGSRVGRIDIKDTFSIVEVDATVAEKVIAALNGTTLRGRSLRVDYDRGGRTERTERGARTGGAGGRGGRGRPGGSRPDRR